MLTINDHCSGWAEAYPIPDKCSQTVEHVFHNRFVAAHDCSETLVSDNGAEFTAKHWSDYLARMGISRPANKLCCAKKYQNRHFVLQAGIYIHLMRKNVLYKY